MILKGNQRAGGRQMALHLLNGEQNEHVHVHEVRGFIASDILGALNEAYALSKGTQCKQFMFSLSLSPPPEASVSTRSFEDALTKVEQKLGLIGQPRVVVFHEKEGRRHAHCVWSRIDIEQMKAIPLPHSRLKLNDIAKSLYIEHGWRMPEGFKDKSRSNPLNYTRAQWQQASRAGKNPADIKRDLQECWSLSDSKAGFEAALRDHGYFLARGDKRGYVVIDVHGEVYSLPRQIGRTQKDVQEKIGDPQNLNSVEAVKDSIQSRLSTLYHTYAGELEKSHKAQEAPLLREKEKMTQTHKAEREMLAEYQSKRWRAEEQKRIARVRHGFKGLWDMVNGRYWKTRKENEQETYHCHLRDQKQSDELIYRQLAQRQELQQQIISLRETQELERQALRRDLMQSPAQEKEIHRAEKIRGRSYAYDAPENENEPEI